MKRTNLILLIFLVNFSLLLGIKSTGWCEDERFEKMERQFNEIKKENEELKRRLDAVEAMDEENIYSLSKVVDVSGYADVEYYHTDQEGENDKFRIRHFSLFFNKDIQKEWKLFTEIEFEDAPFIESTHTTDSAATVQGKLFVEQMYIEYHPVLEWNLRLGRFLTPAGIWSIYHYYPYVPTQERPIHIRKIFPQVSDGIQLRKSFPLWGSLLDSHFYISNGSGNPGRTDRNENKGIGARLNYHMDILNGIEFGASYFGEKDNQNIEKNSYGIHTKLNYSPITLQMEYAMRHNNPESSTDFNDIGAYAQISYDIKRWTFAGRYDWYDKNATNPINDQFRYTGAINYHFAYNVVGKAEYNRNEFDDPGIKDYNEIIMSIVVAIGDL